MKIKQRHGHRPSAFSSCTVESLEHRQLLAGHMLTDINQQGVSPYGPPTSPSRAVSAGSYAIFAEANDAWENVEPFRTDGTASGTFQLKDINPGILPSFPGNFTPFAGAVYFQASTGASNSLVSGLWRTDGTARGTTQITGLSLPGSPSPYTPTNVGNLKVVGSKLFFSSLDGAGGMYLWVSDGTVAGTHEVTDLSVANGNFISSFGTDGNQLYFTRGQNTVWTSDGTSAGTFQVTTIDSSSNISFHTYNGAAYWVSYYGALNSIQTASGTVASYGSVGYSGPGGEATLADAGGVLYALNTDSTAGGVFSFTPGGSAQPVTLGATRLTAPAQATAFDGSLYLTSTASTSQVNLYQVTGATVTPVFAKTAAPALGSISNLTVAGTALYFTDGSGNLWQISTPGATPTIVTSLQPTGSTTLPTGFSAFGNELLFSNYDSANGWEIWKSDGTSAGTRLITNADPATASSGPIYYTPFKNQILFDATDGVHGQELWTTDGTGAGTSMLGDLNPGSAGSGPIDITVAGNQVFFAASDASHGQELWVTDGTASGTHLASDINPGPNGSSIRAIVADGSGVYFSATTGSSTVPSLWFSDGTAAGTRQIFTPSSATSLSPIAMISGDLTFLVSNGSQDTLYSSDGTSAGTQAISNGNSGWLGYFQAIDGLLYFSGSDSAHGREVWRSDGTAAGTGVFCDVDPGPAGTNPAASSNYSPSFIEFDNQIYFTDNLPGGLSYLYRMDSQGHASLLKNFTTSEGGAAPINMQVLNGKLYFLAQGPGSGNGANQLWSTDGTDSGTTLIYEITGEYPLENLQVAGEHLVFGLYTQQLGQDLYFSDGTTAATQPLPWPYNVVNGVLPGSAVSIVGTNILVQADDGVHGVEPWVFDITTNNLSADAGGPYNVSEGNTVTVSADGSSEAGGIITKYEWDFNYDGASFNPMAQGLTASFGAVNIDGPSSRTVAVRVTDADGATAIATANVTIIDVAPTATFSGSTVTVGQSGIVTFSNLTDPSAADLTAGFTFDYDFNNDGTFDVTGSSLASISVPSSYLATVGSHTVDARIFDKDGGYTNYTTSITVNAAAPGSVAGTVTGSTAGETVFLDANNNSTLDSGELSTTTSSTGAFSFASVPAGSYVLRQVLPSGYTQSSPANNAGIAITVAAGAALTGENFTDAKTAIGGSVSGTVTGGLTGETIYLDTNNNSKLDSGEFSTTTTAAGMYSFIGVTAGATIVRQVLPTGYTQVTPSGGLGIHVTVTNGGSLINENFADKAAATTGSIAGTVAGGPSGTVVFLDENNNAVLDSGELSTTTSSTGAYSFASVPAGSYILRQVLVSGYMQTSPASNAGIAVTVTAGTALTGEKFTDATTVTTGSVAGTVTGGPSGELVYLDANNNGVFDSGELPTTTTSTGTYSFGSVAPGAYVVRQLLSSGYTQTSPTGNGGIAVTVAAGSALTGENFVDGQTVTTGSVAGTVTGGPTSEVVYLDANNNSVLDSGELSTTTGSTGNYSFASVPAGSYVLRQVLAAGYAQTAPATNAGIAVTVAAGSALTGENFVDSKTASTGGSVSGTVTGGVVGQTIYVDANNNSKLDSGELSTTTSSTGFYTIVNIPAGATIIRQVLPTGYTQTTPSGGLGIHATITNGGSLANENFVDKAPATSGSVAGTVTGGLAGETIYLDANNNSVLDSTELNTITSSASAFSFTGVPAGSYVLRQVLTGGYTQTSPASNVGISVTVTAGGSLTGKNFTDKAPAAVKLTGTVIGTAGSYNNSGNTITKAVDGSTSTYFDGQASNGNWVGLDLGSAQIVKQIAFAPRSSYASRMTGGSFQISTTADFSSGVTTIYTISATPGTSLTTVTLASPVTARYIRYLSPDGSHGDISEFQVFG